MTVKDLIEQLENEDKDKVVIFRDSMNGWCLLKKTIESNENTIVLIEDTICPFPD